MGGEAEDEEQRRGKDAIGVTKTTTATSTSGAKTGKLKDRRVGRIHDQ